MTKRWRCEQCGQTTDTGMIETFQSGAPEQCTNCGNDRFEGVNVTGVIHSSLQGLPFVG